MRKLKPEYQKLADEFEDEETCCSCHINPPCDYCIHGGNPNNLEENDNAWLTMTTVGVVYNLGASVTYTFMTDEECKVGDKAVVFTNMSWSVVTIVEIHDTPQLDNKAIQYTWLVQIVDRTNYDCHIQEDGEGYAKSVRTRL